ncbi:hypothetical protein [Aeromicrobium ginsengisoli]|uniref:Uncharacterized protein n=1 Tax=Aeromicrobium ginsengisoli TaxID=363867 RepID=A0A5M4F9I4_9ACTN|nr:hypothetical protein [Aeromicrobium ginsengisoli]KAA1394353.1 hypothetical protein ESP70_019325 [Aeromicrobium ginsengisoli]
MTIPGRLTALVDDAAMFPPGNAPVDVAIREHLGHRSSAYAPLIGPLLVRDTDVDRVPELTHESLAIGVVATSGPRGLEQSIAALHDVPHIRVVAFEIPLGDLSAGELVSALAVPDDVTVSVELPRVPAGPGAEWLNAADEIRAAGWQVKFRTGGVEPSAHPDEHELAAVLAALVPRRFKLTAGLHHAVRNTQAGTGFEQHGFVNIMVAVRRLLVGSTADQAAEVLAIRDGGRLAAEVGSWTADDAAAVRETFRGFGCCGVTEPYEDLLELGLIA